MQLPKQFIPGQPITVPNSAFTQEVQQSLVDHYFNGGSTYADTAKILMSQMPAASPSPTPAAPSTAGETPAPQNDPGYQEYLRIKQIYPDLIDSYAKSILAGTPAAQANIQTADRLPVTPPVPQNEPELESWDVLFGMNKEETKNDQESAQERVPESKSNDSQPDSFEQRFIAECVRTGVDYRQATKFISQLTPEDYVILFSEMEKAKHAIQPSPATPPLAPATTVPAEPRQPFVPPINLVEVPTVERNDAADYFPPGRKNSFWK